MSTSPERRLAALAASCHSHLACTPAENSLYCQWYQYCVVVSGSIKHNDIVTPIYIYIYIHTCMVVCSLYVFGYFGDLGGGFDVFRFRFRHSSSSSSHYYYL